MSSASAPGHEAPPPNQVPKQTGTSAANVSDSIEVISEDEDAVTEPEDNDLDIYIYIKFYTVIVARVERGAQRSVWVNSPRNTK